MAPAGGIRAPPGTCASYSCTTEKKVFSVLENLKFVSSPKFLAFIFIDESSPSDDVLRVTESLKTLFGHSSRITNLAWSPHNDGELASVSYDGNAIVSDQFTGRESGIPYWS